MKKIFLVLLSVFMSVGIAAQERILSFSTTAEVNIDSSVFITEKITLQAEHQKIRRGIYRDIPLLFGEKIVINGLEMDGEEHPYFTEKMSKALRINFGNDSYIAQGEHTYTFSYTLYNVLGSFRNHDELYWNAIGTNWDFPIEYARAEVILPPDTQPFEEDISVYTGPKGSKFSGAQRQGLVFETAASLPPFSGMTIAVPFQKGSIYFPPEQQAKKFILSHKSFCLSFILLILFVYGFLAWKKVGKDPKVRILRRHTPPENISPALARYITHMGYEKKIFPAVLVSLALKGALEIVQQNKLSFLLIKKELPSEPLSQEELLVWNELEETKKITPKHDKKIERIKDSLSDNLHDQCEEKYFIKNILWSFPLWILCFLAFGVLLLEIFSSLYLFFIGVFIFLYMNAAGRSNSLDLFLLFGFLFFAVLTFFKSGLYASDLEIALSMGCVAAALFFTKIMSKYTPLGREIANEVEGFKEYLSVAEATRVLDSNPTDLSKIFCLYLPYAIALNVENKWFYAFERIISAEEIKRVTSHRGLTFSSGSFITTLGNISSTLSTAGTPPSSRSGSGGRGSSGGGFGGGGGGGR